MRKDICVGDIDDTAPDDASSTTLRTSVGYIEDGQIRVGGGDNYRSREPRAELGRTLYSPDEERPASVYRPAFNSMKVS
jgi:hypothetical protein